MSLDNKRRVLRAALEPTPGAFTAATLDIQTLAGTLKVEPLVVETVERDVDRPHHDTLGSLSVGAHATVSFDVELAGSGTAGAAPAWGMLLLACGCAEISAPLVAGNATLPPPVASSVTLITGSPSAVDGFYIGRPITIEGPGGPKTSIVTAYDGATKVAHFAPAMDFGVGSGGSTTYTIGAVTLYTPVSIYGDGSTLSFTYEVAEDGSTACTRFKFRAARGDATFKLSEKKPGTLSFSFVALLESRADGTVASVDYSGWGDPLPAGEGTTQLPSVHGYTAITAKDFQMMLGVNVNYLSRLNLERVRIAKRDPAVKLEAEALLLAEHDYYAAVAANTKGVFALSHGLPGNLVAFYAPAMQVKTVAHADADGIVTSQFDTSLRAASSAGNDSFRIVCG